MSFSREIKKEIANFESNDCCLKAELYSIIKFKSQIIISRNNLIISIETTLNAIARRIVYLFKKCYSVNLEIIAVKQQKLDKNTVYELRVEDKGIEILKDLHILDANNNIIDEIESNIFKNECCKASILRGAFLMRGSVNDPSKSNYHLEILANNINDAIFLINILKEVYIDAKYVERKKGIVVYLKKSEQIGDFLKFVGAINGLFYFEDKRIKRDYNNYVNRLINCDIANEEKAIKSAEEQLKNIQFLEKHRGLIDLSQRLTDAIILRNTFPDYSLQQLSDESEELIGRSISKSGLSHCYKDIERLCDAIKKSRK